ncbi:MAG: hypothetical protein JWN44_617 [Myxococcales bacterium]|nr:hypothetical protein [Myxococcales bacterium]
MTESAVVYTNAASSGEAAASLCKKLADALPGAPADVLVLFASPTYDQQALLKALKTRCQPKILVGASSAGEFTHETRGAGLACALALRSSDLHFSAAIARDLSKDPVAAGRNLAAGFRGLTDRGYAYRSALVMTDALAGHADELVDQLTVATSGQYQFFGGGAGDDAQFRRTNVFFDDEAVTDAAVALEILSNKPIGVGVGHGWEPIGPAMRVTEIDGKRLVSLNGMPAVEAFERHAAETSQTLDREAPIPFFLHNILGIDTGSGHRLRVPLAINDDGSVLCASELPIGATVHVMRTTERSAVDAAARATSAAMQGLKGNKPQVALFFDCVATRLRMGDAFGFELKALAEQLGDAEFVGCNTHGQIARAEGQFGGFHNCTAVVCVLPE